MNFSNLIKENEKIYHGSTDMKYFYLPPKKESDFLIITFSGFHGRENEGIPAVYNYVKTLGNSVDCHRLFILDSYNGLPSYYLGKNKSLDYEMTVASLILKIINELKIKSENVITCDSSKGGTAAIYFALKYNLGNACVGAFQVKVGTYLNNVSSYTREKVLNHITGGFATENVKYLDEFYINFFENLTEVKTGIYIHAGDKDPHYLNHVTHFLKIMDDKNVKYNLELKEYDSHGMVGTYYSDYLLETLPKILGKIIIKNVNLSIENNDIKVKVNVPEYLKNNKNLEYAYYIYNSESKKPIKKIMYNSNDNIKFNLKEDGRYRVKVYIKLDDVKESFLSDYIQIEIKQ